jgi:MHS family proline/betaine transporter-like MFS transporter
VQFDFSVHSQLANTITQLFFPSTNPTVSSLSFWAVYAAGFVTRPADALLFG